MKLTGIIQIKILLLSALSTACSLGEVSQSRVPRGSHVMLPNARQQYCYRACTCSHNNYLTHCEEVGCVQRDSCLINEDTIQGTNIIS